MCSWRRIVKREKWCRSRVYSYATKSQSATRQSQRLRLCRAIKSRTRATKSRDKIAGVTSVWVDRLTCASRRNWRPGRASRDQLIAVRSVLRVQVRRVVVGQISVRPAPHWVEGVVHVDADALLVVELETVVQTCVRVVSLNHFDCSDPSLVAAQLPYGTAVWRHYKRARQTDMINGSTQLTVSA